MFKLVWELLGLYLLLFGKKPTWISRKILEKLKENNNVNLGKLKEKPMTRSSERNLLCKRIVIIRPNNFLLDPNYKSSLSKALGLLSVSN